MDKISLEKTSLLVFFGLAAWLAFLVFRPFLQVLTLAIVLAIVLHKPHEKLASMLGGRSSISAAIMVACSAICIAAPLFFFGSQMIAEVRNVEVMYPVAGSHYAETLDHLIEMPVRHFVPSFTIDVTSYAAQAIAFVSANFAGFLSQTAAIIFGLFLMLLALFFFLRDGTHLVDALVGLSPFQKRFSDEILAKTERTIQSVVRGTVFVSLIRWLAIGVGFYAFGIQDALLWGSIGGLIGAIPGLGTLFVVVPAVAYLYLAGHTLAAVGLALYGVLTIVLIDNLLASYFFGKGLEVPPVFILFSILGGILFFGPMGFILGPIVLSLFLTTLHMYALLMLNKEDRV